jgi:hypothetical protein
MRVACIYKLRGSAEILQFKLVIFSQIPLFDAFFRLYVDINFLGLDETNQGAEVLLRNSSYFDSRMV